MVCIYDNMFVYLVLDIWPIQETSRKLRQVASQTSQETGQERLWKTTATRNKQVSSMHT